MDIGTKPFSLKKPLPFCRAITRAVFHFCRWVLPVWPAVPQMSLPPPRKLMAPYQAVHSRVFSELRPDIWQQPVKFSCFSSKLSKPFMSSSCLQGVGKNLTRGYTRLDMDGCSSGDSSSAADAASAAAGSAGLLLQLLQTQISELQLKLAILYLRLVGNRKVMLQIQRKASIG